ncbi:phytoene dehydrogenase [Aspergillus ambiguus]|uniref:phytoene desaturase family protein n=1 Tax=Aspergillus ambiguus TaxID=176160 RepID=UPI003CCD18A2
MTTSTVIIVGAGAGGLATAARLAQQGYGVTVIEKHDYVGGRCSIISKHGYRFDQGPSLVLMPDLFKETFQDLNTTMEQERIELLKCDPNYCIWFADHDTVELSTDLSRLKMEVERHEGSGSFPRLCAFLEEAGTYYSLSSTNILHKNFPSLLSLGKLVRPLMQMRPWETMYKCVSRYFRSDKMRKAWTFASMYLGMSPYKAPGTYTLLQYTETTDGIWYPRGGFHTILQAIADIGKRCGVVYHLNTTVESVILSGKNEAKGVRLCSGEQLFADIVVINADLVYAYNELLPPSSQAQNLKRRPASCSSISFFWAFDKILPQLKPHNIFLADDYRQSFDAIFDKHSIPSDPSFYVNVPSRIDSTAAPTGKEAIVVLIPVGNLTSSGYSDADNQWELAVQRAKDFVLETIERQIGTKDLRSKIVYEEHETPVTWQRKYNLDRGAILGLSHSFSNVTCFRPKTKHPSIQNLYFVGASTHPGTGVPICLASAKLIGFRIRNLLFMSQPAL